MRDKERLELLENGSCFSSDDITFLLKQARLYQISRDDTREACHKVREENKRLEQQNKRYREAITKTNGTWDDVYKQYKRERTQYLDGMLDGLETALEYISEALEGEE